MLHSRQKRTKSRSLITCTEKFGTCLAMSLLRYTNGQLHAHGQTDTLTAILRSPLRGKVMTVITPLCATIGVQNSASQPRGHGNTADGAVSVRHGHRTGRRSLDAGTVTA